MIIKLFRSKKKYFKMNMYYVCVAYKKTNTEVIEKIGTIFYWNKKKVCFLNSARLGYWLNKGCLLKPKVSWLFGLLYGESILKKNAKVKLKQ